MSAEKVDQFVYVVIGVTVLLGAVLVLTAGLGIAVWVWKELVF